MTRREGRTRRLRGAIALLLGALVVVTGVGVTAAMQQAAKAATASAVLDDFDPADIISNGVMFNAATMSASEIQTFLNGKQPSCASGATCLRSVKVDIPKMTSNPMCGAMSAKSSQTAAQVIAAVAKACDVNPQVILVMLQKEQTLVTGRKPYSGETVSLIYRKATGLGCPDTAACDPAKYGLFNQLYGVAYWLVRYTTPPGTTGSGWTSYSWFPVGKANGVLYNPSASCGAKAITIKNKATASLYYYTPYQPNAAALAAGWGLGNGCSSYGNRNFFLYFTTWFGSTHDTVTGAIRTYWSKHTGTYGDPVANATSVAGGTMQRFEKGTLYTSSSGTYGVRGALLTKYTAMGGPAGSLGFPRKAQTTRTGSSAGTAQGFQHGTIYVSKAGTAAVLAPVYAKYMSSGYEIGRLGWPTGDAKKSSASGGATWQEFQGGRIVVASGRSSTVTGSVLSMWVRRGTGSGTLGWPTGDARTVSAHGRTGTVQEFQTGVVTVRGGSVLSVTGTIGRNYLNHGGPAGYLDWPVTASHKDTAAGGGWDQRFANGRVFWNASAGTHGIAAGAALRRYMALGGPSSALGWLRSTAKVTGGTVAVFQHGRIWSRSAGTYSVTGAILTKYLQKGAQAGVLGWPTGQPTTSHGTTLQRFQHGWIRWTASGGATAGRS